MDIESLEINLFKTSEIKDGDTILVKIDDKQRTRFSKEEVKSLYDQITKIAKKNISVYFFPKNISIDIIKNHVTNMEESKETVLKEKENNE